MEGDDEVRTPEVRKQKSVVTIFAIWNTMMGTSMLAMPYGFNQAGFTMGETFLFDQSKRVKCLQKYILGLILIVSIGMITLYTASRVTKSQYHVPRSVKVGVDLL